MHAWLICTFCCKNDAEICTIYIVWSRNASMTKKKDIINGQFHCVQNTATYTCKTCNTNSKIIAQSQYVLFTAAVWSFHCRCSFSYHHPPHLESPLDETSSHEHHHHHMVQVWENTRLMFSYTVVMSWLKRKQVVFSSGLVNQRTQPQL